MRTILPRVVLSALLVTWALSHAAVFGGDKGEKGRKDGKEDKNLTPIERIRKALDKPVLLDWQGQSVMEALQHLREKTGLEFNLDQVGLAVMGVNIEAGTGEPVQMKSAGNKVSVVLRKLLTPQQMAYVIYEDTILITSSELATTRQMKQRVNVDVTEVPLAKALQELARNYAFNLVIDPKIAKDSQKPVTLTLDGSSLETSVRLLAEMAGVKAVRMDNVLFVTTEERADKIRKEEKDLMPPVDDLNNPGNPRIFGGLAVNPAAIGVAGPAFKAVPLPAKDDGTAPQVEPKKEPDVKKDVKDSDKAPPPPPPPAGATTVRSAPTVVAPPVPVVPPVKKD
jgi:hypothetical protein